MGDATWGHSAAILLALLGAACFAVSSALQHHAVRAGHPDGPDHPGASADAGRSGRALTMRHLIRIMRRPRWLAGLGLAGAGTVVHAVALLLAPLRVVQPVGVLAVPLAVLISAARSGRRPAVGVVVGAVVSIIGVVVFVVASAGSAASHSPTGGATLVAGLCVAAVVALLTVVGLARSGTVRCVALAMAGASAFGLVSALVRAVSQSVAAGDVGIFDLPVLGAAAGLVASLAVGGWLVQHAYHAGSPEVVIACLTVVDPIVAVVLGAVLLGEGTATPLATWALLGGAAVAATAGVLTLAHHHPDAVAARAEAAVAV
ncbi:hypothetical protein [Antribacter gilvus]|uniref:hypothetical protein n=1 Tax=Antribacter gilvus TaxID=2304675 RepID=UPI000F7956CA|nr:hypothetical protein [Antribacter gilvus]